AWPVECRKQFHARDDVANRHLRGGLPVMLRLYDLLDALILALHPTLNPFDEPRYVWVLIAQTLCQLHDEGAAYLFSGFQLLDEVAHGGPRRPSPLDPCPPIACRPACRLLHALHAPPRRASSTA